MNQVNGAIVAVWCTTTISADEINRSSWLLLSRKRDNVEGDTTNRNATVNGMTLLLLLAG
jgi:hypothetical protein